MSRVDVAVVGAGPAGASAARAAALGGADTVLIEKGVPREDREGLGPDSTDAAALINYWIDLMELDVADFPDGVVLRELDRAEFNSPNARAVVRDPGLPASYPKLGVTVQRARFDDWLVERARAAGAEYALGDAVRAVETDLVGGPAHELHLQGGATYEAEHLVLADGPQRPVTLAVLDRFLPDGQQASVRMAAPRANHIAYQEYRRFPPEALETDALKFWWGHLPGATSYPWIFPNDGDVALAGDAMGTASPFHEGGTHVAVRSGSVAGELAARGALDRYNDAWKAAIGTEVRRNAAMAAMVRGFEPADWDRAVATGQRILERGARFGMGPVEGLRAIGIEGLGLGARYQWHAFRLRGDRLARIRAAEYRY